MTEKGSEYYDGVYRTSERYGRPAENAPWLPVWKQIIHHIPSGCVVVDLGCGPGHLAELILDADLDVYYVGVDFSEEAIRRAKERKLPFGFEFKTGSLYDKIPDGDTFVLCEVLEHLAHDLDVIEQIPKGSRIILSVPSFTDPSHVRVFRSEKDVRSRYAGQIDFESMTSHHWTDTRTTFIASGTRV